MSSSRYANFYSLLLVAGIGMSTLALAGCGGSMTPMAAQNGYSAATGAMGPAGYSFKTINNNTDPTFNQLLGINSKDTISGYYGSGATGHPNKGYTVVPPYHQKNFTPENYPASAQTQVTCIDNKGNTGGFWIDNAGKSRGFIEWNGVFTSYHHPGDKGPMGTVIDGLNNAGIAAGFYQDAGMALHGFTLNQATGKFTPVVPPGAANVTASAINNKGDVVGFYVQSSQTVGFLWKGGKFSAFHYPNSTVTQPFGVNDSDDIVGAYVDSANKMHGFLLTNPLTHAKWVSIDDPKGKGTTTINGINDAGLMVGFYVDSTGSTDGMLITPK